LGISSISGISTVVIISDVTNTVDRKKSLYSNTVGVALMHYSKDGKR